MPVPGPRGGTRRLLLGVVLLLAAGCATYTARMAEPGELYYEADYVEAGEKLDGLVEDTLSLARERGQPG